MKVEKGQYLRFNMSNTLRMVEKVENDKVYFRGHNRKHENMSLEALSVLVGRGVISVING